MSHTDDCSISIPPLPPLELTRSTSAMSLTTPCSTTMKVAGLTPFQSFLLRPADTRSVVVFIVACIGTFFILLHVKKLTDSFTPATSSTTSEHTMSRHAMTTLSVNEIITPTEIPTQPTTPTLHTIIQFTEDMTGPDGQVLYPITQYVSQLSSYHILSLHALTMTSTTKQPSHYHTSMSELLVIQHGTISLRLVDVNNGHVEDMILSVDESIDHPLAILIHPYVCHIIQSNMESDTPIRMISYTLQSITSTPSSDPIKLLLSDRHTCPSQLTSDV